MMHKPNHCRGRGFTVIELLVVIAIILLVLAMAVPAFSSMVYSSQRSLAVNSLKAAVSVARTLAIESAGGRDAGVVFFYEDERIRVVPVVQVGVLAAPADPLRLDTLGIVRRDVFAPIGKAESITLPRFWGVRGYAPAGSLIDDLPGDDRESAQWYNSATFGGNDPNADAKQVGNWIFPETSLYDQDRQDSAAGSTMNATSPRQTFMVRFEAETGRLVQGGRPSLVVAARPSSLERDRYAKKRTDSNAWKRLDFADSEASWARSVLLRPDVDGKGGPFQRGDTTERLRLIGNASHDTVLVKPVARLAMYDERRLARGLKARGINKATGSIYRPFDSARSVDSWIGFDELLFSNSDPEVIRKNINSWISGDTAGGGGALIGDGKINFDQDKGDVDEPEARLFFIRAYTGELVEVQR